MKYALTMLTSLFAGGVATVAATVFADIPLNFANIIVLPLILGIGVDNDIHAANVVVLPASLGLADS